jgi:hypothetical protein
MRFTFEVKPHAPKCCLKLLGILFLFCNFLAFLVCALGRGIDGLTISLTLGIQQIFAILWEHVGPNLRVVRRETVLVERTLGKQTSFLRLEQLVAHLSAPKDHECTAW